MFAAGHHGFSDFNEAIGLSLDTPEHSIFNPYGVVQVSLSDLLTGTRKMRMECGVLPCVRTNTPKAGASTSSHVAGMDIEPVHAGHYMEAGSYLVVGYNDFDINNHFDPLFIARPRQRQYHHAACAMLRYSFSR